MAIHSTATGIVATLLASTLAAAPSAWAQQGGERREVRTSTQAFTIAGDQNGRAIELVVTDGKVVRAVVDGEQVPPERVRRTRSGYELLAADGGVLAHVEGGMQVAPPMPAPARGGRGGEPSRAEVHVFKGPDGVRREIVVEGRPLAQAGEALPPPKSMIGAGLGPVDEALAAHLGVDAAKTTMLTAVMDGLPAQKAGLQRFDVIVSVNGAEDASPDAVRAAMRASEPGAKVKLGFRRGSRNETVELEVAAFDAEKLATMEGELGERFGVAAPDAMPGPGDVDVVMPGVGTMEGGRVFFFGPDGERRELRLPPMPSMQDVRERIGPERIEQFERTMHDMERRMSEWAERMERRFRGGEAGDQPREPRQPRGEREPRAEGAPREGARGPADAPSEDRIRRLEEQVERLMRELEKSNARGPRPSNDA